MRLSKMAISKKVQGNSLDRRASDIYDEFFGKNEIQSPSEAAAIAAKEILRRVKEARNKV